MSSATAAFDKHGFNPRRHVRAGTSWRREAAHIQITQDETDRMIGSVLRKEFTITMKARVAVAVAVAAVILGVAAPVSSAMAFSNWTPVERYTSASPYQSQSRGTLGPHDGPMFNRCPASSASEGNANQQNFPVKQYGQTSGGPLC